MVATLSATESPLGVDALLPVLVGDGVNEDMDGWLFVLLFPLIKEFGNSFPHITEGGTIGEGVEGADVGVRGGVDWFGGVWGSIGLKHDLVERYIW